MFYSDELKRDHLRFLYVFLGVEDIYPNVCVVFVREIVKQVAPKISSRVPVVSVYQQNGNAMAMKTVNMEKMRNTVSQVKGLSQYFI